MNSIEQMTISQSELIETENASERAEAEINKAIAESTIKPGQDITWQKDARCRDELVDVELFYSEDGASDVRAKMFCGQCAVLIGCLNYALQNNEKHGVWGGMSADERRRLKRMAP